MKSPICVSNICVTSRKQTASFSIAGLMLALAPLWLMLATANTSQAQTTSSPADWREFHRDNMQRWNPYETVLGVSNVGSLRPRWRNTVGPVGGYEQFIGQYFESAPAVVNGVLYIGSDDGNVYALSAATGAQLWNYTTGNPVDSSPAVVNGIVYVGSLDENVYALNAGTGVQLWSYRTGYLVESSPAVVNGIVYIGSDDGSFYALNAATGAKLWSFDTGEALAGSVEPSPALANGAVYFGSWDGNVYALNAGTGRQTVELCHGRTRVFLARAGKWGGLYRLLRRKFVCAERRHRRQTVEL